MARMMAACGVLCSGCAAYLGRTGNPADRERGAAGWHRIYGLNEKPENMSCGGCQSPDEEVFHTCRACRARLCCRSKGFANCAECEVKTCPDLKKAQSGWDGVPEIAKTLSRDDFVLFAQPYLGHRRRLAAARARRHH